MEKQRWEESERRREEVWRSEKRKREKKEDAGGRKAGKSRFTMFFQWYVALEGRRVGSLKRRVRSHLARWGMKNCTPFWREAPFQVKMHKAHNVQRTFGRWEVEKVDAAMARSRFQSQKCKKLRGMDHFWTFRNRFAWQAQGNLHLAKSEQNVRVL